MIKWFNEMLSICIEYLSVSFQNCSLEFFQTYRSTRMVGRSWYNTITILSLTYFRFFTLLSLEINWSVKKCASILNKLIYGKVKKLNSINILYFKFYEKFKGKKIKEKWLTEEMPKIMAPSSQTSTMW